MSCSARAATEQEGRENASNVRENEVLQREKLGALGAKLGGGAVMKQGVSWGLGSTPATAPAARLVEA